MDRGDRNRELLLDPIMLELCGDVDGKRVLDAGCGEGRFCRRLAKRGAITLGFDPIPELLSAASTRSGNAYVLARAEQIPLQSDSFDIVVSYLTLLDIEGFRSAIQEMVRVLRPGGSLVVANQNAFVTTNMSGWHKSPTGERLHFPVDRYLEERGEWTQWSGIRILNYHRPLSAYLEAFLGQGLLLRRFLEPGPTAQMVRADPELEQWRRVPYFYVAKWELPATGGTSSGQ